MTGFLGCCLGFGYIVVVVVHYTSALFYRMPQPRARWQDEYLSKSHGPKQ